MTLRRTHLALAVAALAAAACAAPARADALAPPPGYAHAVGSDDIDGRSCTDDAVPYVGALDFPSKYQGSDKARDDLNKRAEARYKRLTAPIREFERGVSRQVNDFMRSGDREALDCALGLLSAWSQAHALEGDAKTHTGKSMRKWALASVASSYLRLKFSVSRPLAGVDPERIRGIEDWFSRLADRVVAEWRDQPLKKVNNHQYWAAWAVTATAVVLDRRDLFDWALAQYRLAASQVDDEGFLPNELARDTRALYYHNYALTPLAMIAAFAHANGVDVAGENDRALERLAARVLSGIDDPDEFEEHTGDDQNVSEFSERSKMAWLEPYCWTVRCSEKQLRHLESLRPLSSTRLGGNLSDLFDDSAGRSGS